MNLRFRMALLIVISVALVSLVIGWHINMQPATATNLALHQMDPGRTSSADLYEFQATSSNIAAMAVLVESIAVLVLLGNPIGRALRRWIGGWSEESNR